MPTEASSDRSGAVRLRALKARGLIDLLTLRLAPALTAGLIASSHLREPGEGLIVFLAMFAVATAIERTGFPLRLMPGARVLVSLVVPLAGAGIAWLLILLVAGSPGSFLGYQAIVLGAWLMLAVGAWIRAGLAPGLRVRVAVIGQRDFAADLAVELATDRLASYEVVGWVGSEGPAEYRRLRWLGGLGEVRSAVIDEQIELLVAAAEAFDSEGDQLQRTCDRVADQCLDLPVRLMTANQLYEETFGHVPAGTIDAAWYRYIMHPRFRTSTEGSKRAFDLLVGSVIGLVASPILALAAVAIKLTDGGPALYRQTRIGERGHRFEILKLRTMRVDAETAGMQWSGADDHRVTRVGSVLRRTHLDELPQIWNVLRGDMTLVGPRPERPEIVTGLERRFAHYTRRQLVKPGIAGWAQLRCGYAGSELGTAWKLCHDLFYIKHRSVLGDLLILTETAFVAFRDAHRALRSPQQRFLLQEEPGAAIAAGASVGQPATVVASVGHPGAAMATVSQPATVAASVRQPATVGASVGHPATAGAGVGQPAADLVH